MKNKLLVIKCGGSILNGLPKLPQIINNFKQLIDMNYNLIIVHGGGPEISLLCKKLGIETGFINGLRVTTDEVLSVTQMALNGITNPKLVYMMNQGKVKALGLSGHLNNLLLANPLDTEQYGHVGEIVSVNTPLLNQIISLGFIPVIAPLAIDKDGQVLNINADLAAAAIATATKASQLILLSDVDGYYSDYSNKASLINQLTMEQLDDLLLNNNCSITDGMIPKLQACQQAVKGSVESAHIINGNKPDDLINLVLTRGKTGTTITVNPLNYGEV